MWTVLYLAQSKEDAEKIKNALESQGILVRLRSIGKNKNGQCLYEVMVPQSEIDYAYPILTTVIF